MKYIVKDIIKSDIARGKEKGNMLYTVLYNKIAYNIENNIQEKILVSFANITNLNYLFCSKGLGKLFKNFDEDYLFNFLEIVEVENESYIDTIKVSIANSILLK